MNIFFAAECMTGPEIWGPRAWASLHAFAASYPETARPADVARARAWLHRVRVPCGACQVKYDMLLMGLEDADVQGRERLFEWTVRVHNTVNVLLGKPVMPDSEAKQRYGIRTTHFSAMDSSYI